VRVTGLFAGVGGIELGLGRSGHEADLLCENDPGAAAVLRARFPGVPLAADVRDLDALPPGTDLVAAGFPCQDLSQCGATKGISGEKSGLVSHLFRLLEACPAPWVLLENVPFMLRLGGGAAIRHLADRLESLGYRWAYRVVDARAFGIPQRRERVILLASLADSPASVLFSGGPGAPGEGDHRSRACGFYWTEGRRGLGWAVDAVPTMKGGSGLGIPSPPAIWMPDGRIVTPDIRDAERLQGLPPGWTEPAEAASKPSHRWKLVGNAVNAAVSSWVGARLAWRRDGRAELAGDLPAKGGWPKAAAGESGGRRAVRETTWPAALPAEPLADFLQFEPKPLSERATAGFLGRLLDSSLRYPPEFRAALEAHLERMRAAT